MTDAEMLALVQRHAAHWLPHLGLENWRVFTKADAKLAKKNVLMEIIIDRGGYQRVTIACNATADEARYESLETDVLHELLHIPLDKLDDVAWAAGPLWQQSYRKAEEGVIDMLAASFMRLHHGCRETS